VAILNFYQSKPFWIFAIIISPLLLATGQYRTKIMDSVYKQDFGNGVIVYADDFVSSGKWVYNCRNSRLISRQPLIAPIAELREEGKLTIGEMYSLSSADKAQAIAAVKATAQMDVWYMKYIILTLALMKIAILPIMTSTYTRHDDRLWRLSFRSHYLRGSDLTSQ